MLYLGAIEISMLFRFLIQFCLFLPLSMSCQLDYICSAGIPYGCPNGPLVLCSCDLNKDGKQDVAVGSFNRLELFLNQGNYSFDTLYYSLVHTPAKIVSTDFNKDTYPDLIFYDMWGNVSQLLSNGTGSFYPVQTYSIGGNINTMTINDFNNDGNLDAAVKVFNSNPIYFLKGTLTGTFSTVITFSNAIAGATITSCDFDKDGKVDIVINGNSLNLLKGTANFSFVPISSINVPSFNIESGDLNGDGYGDIVATNATTFGTSLFFGNSSATLTAPINYVAGGADILKIYDHNQDNIPDICVSTVNSQIFTCMLNNGSGILSSINTYSTNSDIKDLAFSDFNNDGKIDCAVAAGNDVSVLYGHPDKSLPSVCPNEGGLSLYMDFCLFDLDSDIYKDMCVLAGNRINLLKGSGTQAFSPFTSFTISPAISSVLAEDFNNDGKTDLVFANYNPYISILLNNGGGTFASAAVYSVSIPYVNFGYPNSIASADFNGDGFKDIAQVNYGSKLIIYYNDGLGGFSNNTVLTSPSTEQWQIATKDLNFDGKPDLLITNSLDQTISVLINPGSGNFSLFATYSTPGEAIEAAVQDFDGDGSLDIAITDNISPESIVFFKGSSSGTFSIATTMYNLKRPDHLTSGDFNNDNKLDLAFASENAYEFSILYNSGNFNFSPLKKYLSGFYCKKITSSDVNNDNLPDLAILSDAVRIYINECDSYTDVIEYSGINRQLKVYPNPTTGLFKIVTTDVASVEVFDILGQKVISVVKYDGKYLDLSNFSSGPYFVRIISDSGIILSSKLIKY